MPIRVFGAPPNRTHRVLWMLEEGDLAYDLERLHSSEEIAASDALAKYNPNRKVPTLVDEDVAVWDSLAINLYLADRYTLLLPEGPGAYAHAVQWSLFAQVELDGRILAIAKARFGAEEERDEAVAAAAEQELEAPLAVLERALVGRDHLVGSSFSVADLNVAAVMVFAPPLGVDFTQYPAVDAWLRACLERPVAKDVFARAFAELV